MKSFIPLPFEVVHVKRTLTRTTDELGNDVWDETTVEEPVKVAGWAAPAGDEPKLVGHDRQTVNVELLAPTGVFSEHDAVQLPDRDERLEVIGSPSNYDHNPFGWTPGIEVVNLGGIS